MSRRTSRETALQALYQMDFHENEENGIMKERAKTLSDEDLGFYTHLLQGVQTNKQQIDHEIEQYLKKGWSLYRLSSIDRAILRLSTFELLFDNTPKSVVLNEAVDLAKSFSGEESSRFINGILGALVKSLESK
ncbi:transcription antitermination factor NusB [Hazenella sp. IB182357]|uniref:Transcription antitermination protein NusB n=1 Tax=Polycladospora coralii TaxID=2771432 RepID=A0A926N6M2_9BACL|nr:transcription antitermination factor NusB [Polycladospora coralii]MBD1373249.1 transcription antitermination factor NusB [Polycladospora coralii]